MNRRNLMPPLRLAAKRHRRAVRRWVTINGAYLLLLVAAGVAYACGTAAPASPDTAFVAAEIERTGSKVAALKQQTATLDASLRAAREVSARPDWAALLSVLGGIVGDDAVLDAVDCTTADSPAAAPPRRLTLTGVGRSQQAVSEFVLRLERLGFFERVRLVQTRPQTLRGHDGVGFRVVCVLADWPGGAS